MVEPPCTHHLTGKNRQEKGPLETRISTGYTLFPCRPDIKLNWQCAKEEMKVAGAAPEH
jgi:hypothetical protein